MEIVYLQKRPLNLPLQKFAELDTLLTQMGIACTPNKPLHQLHILALLDSSLMETVIAFPRQFTLSVQLDMRATEMGFAY